MADGGTETKSWSQYNKWGFAGTITQWWQWIPT